MPTSNKYIIHSRISEAKFRQVLKLFCLDLNATQIAESSGLSRNTINPHLMAIRTRIAEYCQDQSPISGHVEVDESYFGARRAKGVRGRGARGKTIVFGIYKRNGHVRTFPVSTRRRVELLAIVDANTTIGSLYYTDEYRAYASLRLRGTHVTVAKEKGIRKGRTLINGIEGFWSYAKHWLYTYRGFRKEVFPLFLKEVEWRFNNRHENLIPILSKLMKSTTPDPRLLQA